MLQHFFWGIEKGIKNGLVTTKKEENAEWKKKKTVKCLCTRKGGWKGMQ